jgi:hypothetical protein
VPNQTSQYAAAAAELRRIGCAKASGDALAAMYAKLVCETNALSTKSPCIDRMFNHLREKSEDLHAEAKRLLQDPMAALDIALG